MMLVEKTYRSVTVDMTKDRMEEVLNDLLEHGYSFSPLLTLHPATRIDCVVYFRGSGPTVFLLVSRQLSCFCPVFQQEKPQEEGE